MNLKLRTHALACLLALIVCSPRVSAGQTPTSASVTLDKSQTGAPISKYIYGQFIEHLGRCIYGGIWAEMLEDRKFYYPIKDEYNPWGTATDRNWKAGEFKFLNGSPWKVIGPSGTVTMSKDRPYAGEHTPTVRLPGGGQEGGVSQEGLELLRGKKYEGYVVLAGDAPEVLVRLVLDDTPPLERHIKRLTKGFKSTAFRFTAPASSQNARLEIVGTGTGHFAIGAVSLMPADNIKGWRRDTVALLRELNSPVYRWPGGNFVSGYNWKDGIGDRDRRPPRKNPAWKGIEHNDVGIHEYMDLMGLLKAEPYIAVNTGLGTVQEVAKEVEYCNGSAETEMGHLRAKNGHSAPYGVKFWAVGNEMYGDWQLGHMPLSEYVKKHKQVVDAMWKVDPSIQLVGVGAVGDWTKTMLSACPETMNLISEHIYCKDKPQVAEHTAQLAQEIKRVADAHREYRATIPELKGKTIPVAMDEWNYWYGDYLYGELGVRYFMKDGLGVAKGLHEYFRNTDVYYMANYAQTVNVIGAIKTSRTAAEFESTGLVLRLYREQFGSIPLKVSQPDPNLDVSAALTADRKGMTLAIVNSSGEQRQVVFPGAFEGCKRTLRQWAIGNPNPQSYNEPGQPPAIRIVQTKSELQGDTLSVGPYSVSLYRLELR